MLKHFKDLALIILLIFGLLGLCEFALRVAFPGRNVALSGKSVLAGDASNPAYAFHPESLVVLKPDVEKVFQRTLRNGGDVIRWQTGAEAFRGGTLREESQQEEHTSRIMVYGDSNIQARFSMQERSFAGRLEAHLETHGKTGIEVVNAGVIGSGPDQDLLRAQEEIPLYAPDEDVDERHPREDERVDGPPWRTVDCLDPASGGRSHIWQLVDRLP